MADSVYRVTEARREQRVLGGRGSHGGVDRRQERARASHRGGRASDLTIQDGGAWLPRPAGHLVQVQPGVARDGLKPGRRGVRSMCARRRPCAPRLSQRNVSAVTRLTSVTASAGIRALGGRDDRVGARRLIAGNTCDVDRR